MTVARRVVTVVVDPEIRVVELTCKRARQYGRVVGTVTGVLEAAQCVRRISRVWFGAISIHETIKLAGRLIFASAGVPFDRVVTGKEIAVERAFLNGELRRLVWCDGQRIVGAAQRDWLRG